MLEQAFRGAGALGGAAAGGYAGQGAREGGGLFDLLKPLDYPRQALYNVARGAYRGLNGDGSWDDLMGALPGAAGLAAGGALAATGVGAPLAIGVGSLVGGALQGLGKASDHPAFNAATPDDLAEGLTGSRDDPLVNMGLGIATDPLTYAGFGAGEAAGARAGKAAESGGLKLAELLKGESGAANLDVLGSEARKVFGGAEAAAPNAPTFYSRLDQAAAKLPNKADGPSILNYLKGKGIKDEEIAYRGLPDMLAGRKGVTRDEVLQHLQGNPLNLDVTTHGGIPHDGMSADEVKRLIDLDEKAGREGVLPGAEDDEYRQLARRYDSDPGTHYGDYTLPGGDQYKETLLRLPDNKLSPGQPFDTTHNSHWEEPNVLGHYRSTVRTTPEGEKVLHLEELQSDWHQQGRKSGYDNPAQPEAVAAAEKKTDNLRQVMQKAFGEDLTDRSLANEFTRGASHYQQQDEEMARALFNEMPSDVEEAVAAHMGGDAPLTLRQAVARAYNQSLRALDGSRFPIPDAPFKDNWHELLIKQALRDAAEQGIGRVAVTPGEAQIARYQGKPGEGMARFYDQTVPRYLEKYLKPYGAGPVTPLSLPELGGQTLHSIPLPEAARQAFLHKGQPMMSLLPLLMGAGAAGGGGALLANQNS